MSLGRAALRKTALSLREFSAFRWQRSLDELFSRDDADSWRSGVLIAVQIAVLVQDPPVFSCFARVFYDHELVDCYGRESHQESPRVCGSCTRIHDKLSIPGWRLVYAGFFSLGFVLIQRPRCEHLCSGAIDRTILQELWG